MEERKHHGGAEAGCYSLAGRDSSGRKVNEDAYSMNVEEGVFGVYDGNGKTKELLLSIIGVSEDEWPSVAAAMGSSTTSSPLAASSSRSPCC